MSAGIEPVVADYLAHKRALGRKYHSEENELRLLVRFAGEHHVSCLGELTPALLEEFLASRPRSRPRSFNHLLGGRRPARLGRHPRTARGLTASGAAAAG